MRWLVKFVFFFTLFGASAHAQSTKKPWIYFDLGDTVINAKDMKHLHYISGAQDYLRELKLEGYNIGLITNIPETWGMDYKQKLETLKKFIADGWDDSQSFEWEVFDEVILPLSNSELKPNPTLFLKAITKAQACPSVYIGESPKEIAAATNVGMAAKLFVEQDPDLYIPTQQIHDYLKDNYKLDYDKTCLE